MEGFVISLAVLTGDALFSHFSSLLHVRMFVLSSPQGCKSQDSAPRSEWAKTVGAWVHRHR